jgi:hypothetical protein
MGRPSPVVHRKVRDLPLGGRSQPRKPLLCGLPDGTSSFIHPVLAAPAHRRTANESELPTLSCLITSWLTTGVGGLTGYRLLVNL